MSYFKEPSSEFVYVRSYSHWLETEKRREIWPETVQRYMDFMMKHRGNLLPIALWEEIHSAILNFEVMPSMRALWAAGPAADADNITMYNCAYAGIRTPKDFAEALYILMCGTGYGFRVTQDIVAELPYIPPNIINSNDIHVIGDSREGWAESVHRQILALFNGEALNFDYSKIRPKGTRLKTMGGRASGPEPLKELHNFILDIFRSSASKQLRSIQVHDILNKIAEIVVVGGVRRSSEISLSDLEDEEMANAKNWPFPLYRTMANNSAVYLEKPPLEKFWREWNILAASGTGERGIVNVGAMKRHAPKRRNAELLEGVNPCAEIALRSREFCNLSEILVKSTDSVQDLLRKARIATAIGCIQSTFTDFQYLSPDWKRNCEEERLLGVSLTGQMDAPALMTPEVLEQMKAVTLSTAQEISKLLGINMPAAITCSKPSGTVSQLLNCASGAHPRWNDYYIRRYRISAADPLLKMMVDQGFKAEPEVGSDLNNINTYVLSFPMKSPEGCKTRKDIGPIDQLKHYLMLQKHWSEHNVSLTCYVPEDQWQEVGQFVYDNFDDIVAVSFLPSSDLKYALAPYEDISKEQYEAMVAELPMIDYSMLRYYEVDDNTSGAKTLACSGTSCELV